MNGSVVNEMPFGISEPSCGVSTHAKDNSIDVLFIGWSLTKENSIFGKDDTDPTGLITTVDISNNTTVYAVWGYDANGNGTAYVYEEIIPVPDTGDASNIILWLSAMISSLFVSVYLTLKMKKSDFEN